MSKFQHRIALITGCVKLGGSGSTNFLLNLAGELVQRQVPVEIFCFESHHSMALDFQSRQVPIISTDETRLIFEDQLKIVLEHLKRFQPTVVVSTLGATSFEVLRYLPKRIFRIGMGQSDDPIVYDMMRHYPPWMDMTAMVSKAMKQKAEAMPEFGKVPVECLPYGVPMCPEVELPARNPAAPLRILYLGRLHREQKRVQIFPEILRQLCASNIPFHWTIAGDGEERSFLEAHLKPVSPIQTVSFAGSVPYADVPNVLKQHDVFLLASDYEGLPLSLLEAMGYGLVPVVSDLKSGIPEVVDARNGCLVPVNDVAGYAHAIIHLHEHRDELAAKSAAARLRVQREFSVAAMTDRWLATFPVPPAAPPVWSDRWKISAPLAAKNPIHFSPPVRALRRLAVMMRK